MNSINPTRSGPEYIEFLRKIYGDIVLKENGASYIKRAWDAWEKQGNTRPVDIDKTIDSFNKFTSLYYQDILSSISQGSDISYKNPYLGHVSIRNMNAHAFRADNNDLVIILDDHLDRFLTEFLITLTVCTYSKPTKQEMDMYYSHAIDTLSIFSHDPNSIDEFHSERFLTILQKDYDLAEWGNYIARSILFFILSHEISHHTLGHTSVRNMLPAYINNEEKQSILYDQKKIEDEFEADVQGYSYYHNLINNSENLEWAKVNDQLDRAPLLFFEILDIYHRFREVKEGRHIVYNDHPPAEERMKNLLIKYKSTMSENGVEIYEGLMEAIEYIRERFHKE